MEILHYKKIKSICRKYDNSGNNYEDYAHDYVVKYLEGANLPWVKQFVFSQKDRKRYDTVLDCGDSTHITDCFSYKIQDKELISLVKRVAKVKSRDKNITKYIDCFLEGYSYSQIGKIFNTSKQHINQSLNRVFKHCRPYLESYRNQK